VDTGDVCFREMSMLQYLCVCIYISLLCGCRWPVTIKTVINCTSSYSLFFPYYFHYPEHYGRGDPGFCAPAYYKCHD